MAAIVLFQSCDVEEFETDKDGPGAEKKYILQVLLLSDSLGYSNVTPIENAIITLYNTEEDRLYDNHPIITRITDYEGKATFYNLKEGTYYQKTATVEKFALTEFQVQKGTTYGEEVVYIR